MEHERGDALCSLADDLLARVDEETLAGDEYWELAEWARGLGAGRTAGELLKVAREERNHASLLSRLAHTLCPGA